MKKLLFIALLGGFTQVVSAQKMEQLIGKWKYKAIYNKNKADTAQNEMLKMMFGDMEFHFNTDKRYAATLFKKEDGTWSYNETDKKITMTSAKGKVNTIEIIDFSNDNMTIKLGEAQIIVQKTVSIEPK